MEYDGLSDFPILFQGLNNSREIKDVDNGITINKKALDCLTIEPAQLQKMFSLD